MTARCRSILVVSLILLALGSPRPARGIGLADDGLSRTEHPSDLAADSVRGRTIRWTWTEGPTAGVTHEHVFGEDGTVIWRVLSGPQEGHSAVEQDYEVFRVSENVYSVSYLASSGYTLTVVLNFESGEMFGFASGQGQWFPGRGTFEVVE